MGTPAHPGPESEAEPAQALLERAFARHRSGALQEAWPLYEAALTADPGNAEAHHLFGVLALMMGRRDEGRARIERAAEVAPGDPDIWRNLATARLGAGDEDGALEALERALTLHPGHRGAAMALGALRFRRGEASQAEHLYRTLPGHPPAYRALTRLLLERGEYAEALDIADQALSLEEEPAVEGIVNRGLALAGLDRPNEAAELFRHALALDPECWPARIGLAEALAAAGDWQGAIRAYGPQVADLPALTLAVGAVMPLVPANRAELDQAWETFQGRLADLRRRAAFIPNPNALVGGVAVPLLAAQARDTTALRREQADTLRDICPVLATTADHAGPDGQPEGRGRDGRRRVGILSARLRLEREDSPEAGLVEALCRLGGGAEGPLDIVLIAPGPASGPLWTRLSAQADHSLALPRDLLRAHPILESLNLDVLVFPDLGEDPFQTALAHARMAPVQIAMAGHPEAMGLASIDWFVVSEAVEPGPQQTAAVADRMVERDARVRLPGLLAPVRAPTPEQADRTRLNLPDDGTLYLVARRPEAIHPDMDSLFRRILTEDPGSRLCVFRVPQADVMRRLTARLEAAGVPESRVLWLRRSRLGVRLAAFRAVDVVLDALYWSGWQSSMEALALGTPVVTLQGPFLRARRTAGLCRHLGVGDLVARTEEAYVRLALSLGRERDRRQAFADRLKATVPQIWEDQKSIEALVSFLTECTPRPAGRVVRR